MEAPPSGGSIGFVPTTAIPAGERIEFMLKPLRDGRRALLVYSSRELLIEVLGEQQPWVALRESQIEDVFHGTDADVIALDQPMPADEPEPDDHADSDVSVQNGILDLGGN